MSQQTKYLVAEVDVKEFTAHVHYVLTDRTHAQGLASHGRIAFVECAELDRRDAVFQAIAEAIEEGKHDLALQVIRREFGQ